MSTRYKYKLMKSEDIKLRSLVGYCNLVYSNWYRWKDAG